MRFAGLLLASALTLAACGAVAPSPNDRAASAPPAPVALSPPHRTASVRPTSVRFVAPPLVYFEPKYGGVEIWVRLNRPLHHNVGEPHDYADARAELSVPNSHGDIPGIEHDALRPTCYYQSVYLDNGSPVPAAGDQVPVTLDLGHGQRVTATATAQRLDDGAGYPDGEKLLGCPRLPDTHVCHSEVFPRHFDEISVMSATGTSCATARAVMESVARWVSDRCYEHLCVSKHRINRGFRCDAGLKGEASWDIICDRGNAEVRGWAAD